MADNGKNISRRGFLGISMHGETANAAVIKLAAVGEHCLAFNSISCRSCEDHCDERAIRFRPRIGQCELPHIIEDLCTGCGQCVPACPNAAIELAQRDVRTTDNELADREATAGASAQQEQTDANLA